MLIIMRIVRFAANGARTFCQAARGQYNEESDAIKSLRVEMLSHPDMRINDVLNMKRDRMMVGRDARVSFNKITTGNG